MAANRLSDLQFRLLGILPLSFFLAQAIHYWQIGEPGHVLWMCNIGNLLLAIGLFLNHPLLIRVAVIWTIPGLVVWFVYVALAWGMFFSSTLAHIGSLMVALVALRRVKMDRTAWVYALAWYFVIQLLSYLTTTPGLNVNVSHRVAPGWEQIFTAYWKFWLALTLVAVAVLWSVGTMLRKIWPAQGEGPSTL